MRVLKRILIGLVVLVAAFLGAGFLLPRIVTVKRSVAIQAAPEAIFPHVNSLRATQAWSPWMERDPDVALTFSGPDSGVGAVMSWASDNPQVGQGRQEITLSQANDRVETALDFGEMGLATASFQLQPDGAATVLTWGLQTDMGAGPVGRWMGLMMDRWVGGDYERGLANLKALVEG